MSIDELKRRLAASFHPAAGSHLDATFRLELGGQRMAFHVAHGELSFEPDDAAPDVTFYFRDAETAEALLIGAGDAIEAFMQGAFRADGYLMWAFALLAMFRRPSLPSD